MQTVARYRVTHKRYPLYGVIFEVSECAKPDRLTISVNGTDHEGQPYAERFETLKSTDVESYLHTCDFVLLPLAGSDGGA
jgi:hypothetical protein